MRKATILSITLLVWVLAASAMAAGPPALKGTWVGTLTFVHADGSSITTDNSTLTFIEENGDFLSGTLACTTTPCVTLLDESIPFSCIRNGDSLQMTAEGYLMSAMIFQGHIPKKGTPPPPNVMIQGNNFQDGDTFRGTLTKR